MKTKGIIILVVIVAVLAVGGYFGWKYLKKDDAPKPSPDDVSDNPFPFVDVDTPTGLPRPEPVFDISPKLEFTDSFNALRTIGL